MSKLLLTFLIYRKEQERVELLIDIAPKISECLATS